MMIGKRKHVAPRKPERRIPLTLPKRASPSQHVQPHPKIRSSLKRQTFLSPHPRGEEGGRQTEVDSGTSLLVSPHCLTEPKPPKASWRHWDRQAGTKGTCSPFRLSYRAGASGKPPFPMLLQLLMKTLHPPRETVSSPSLAVSPSCPLPSAPCSAHP